MESPEEGPLGSSGAAAASVASLPRAVAESAAAGSTGFRTTTGGIGRDPGMLMRTRVVSVVSVLGSSGSLPFRNELSLSRLKAGSPGCVRRTRRLTGRASTARRRPPPYWGRPARSPGPPKRDLGGRSTVAHITTSSTPP
ncbi:hypothetical protein FNX44_008550 [Streptomyces sp. OF1]|uniref:Uncharacterized protein n=1 Tax=Streptomyces alkaliterrae TaxID=2213162 RepID=A0A5P0YNS0_9ACTN|nr:hypothetical protein [Streptomyces alkaliterrae]